jgi:hypothetical protein
VDRWLAEVISDAMRCETTAYQRSIASDGTMLESDCGKLRLLVEYRHAQLKTSQEEDCVASNAAVQLTGMHVRVSWFASAPVAVIRHAMLHV